MECALPCHLQLFVCAAQQHAHALILLLPAVISKVDNIPFHVICAFILVFVDAKPNAFAPCGNGAPQHRTMLSQPAREDQGIDLGCTAEFEIVRANEAEDAVDQYVER